MGYLIDNMTRRLQSNPFAVQQQINNIEGVAVPQQQTEQPQVDTSNAIVSLADLLGPTPAEREAQQARLERGRQQMTMWTGLIDGLRQLGNLYYTAQGARPQQFSDPYKMVDETYQREAKRLDDLTAYRRAYANQLYNLQRQAGEDRRKDILTAAQANYYDTRDEVARMKAENDRLKNEKYIELQDGRIAKLNAETGRIEALTPLQQEEIRSRTAKNNRMGYGRSGGGSRGANNGTYGYKTTTYYDDQGRKVTERVPTTGNQPRGQEQPTKKVTQPKKAPKTQKPAKPSGNKNSVNQDRLRSFSIRK